MAKLEISFTKTLGKEGGFTINPNDSGGPTKWGVTESEARSFGYAGNMKDLPIETAHEIYRQKYWAIIHGDEIVDQDIADKVFDIAVLLGTPKAQLYVQIACNVMNKRGTLWPDLIIDARIGPVTVSTLNKAVYEFKPEILKILNCMKGHWLIMCGLAPSSTEALLMAQLNELVPRPMTSDKNEVFMKGWLHNRVD